MQIQLTFDDDQYIVDATGFAQYDTIEYWDALVDAEAEATGMAEFLEGELGTRPAVYVDVPGRPAMINPSL